MATKSSITYRFICDVPSTALSTVMGVLEGVAQIVEVRPVGAADGAPAKPNAPRYAGGKRSKGISGKDFALQILRKYRRPVSPAEMEREFKERGFAPSSWSPSVSRLGKKVVRGDNGYLALSKGA